MINKKKFKNATALLSATGIASVAVIVSALGVSNVASAAVDVNDNGTVKLFGDVRLRMESDKQTKQDNTDRKRDRTRYRARIGASYQANDAWSGKIRLATGTALNSPHVTWGTAEGTSADMNMGVDIAYIAFTGVENLTVIAGKTPLNFWQQTEVFWDTDITAEAFAAVYQAGPVTLNGAYAMLVDGGWDTGNDDITAIIAQAVYNTNLSGMKFTGALGGAKVDDPDNALALNSDSHTSLSAQLKGANWRVGAEYIAGNADKEDTAYVIQSRYKINDIFGVRAYYYHVEANATLGDGLFTQDNFPSKQTAADNFKGYRLQMDMKVAKNTGIDLRYYVTDIIQEGIDDQAKSHDRLQLNVNVKF